MRAERTSATIEMFIDGGVESRRRGTCRATGAGCRTPLIGGGILAAIIAMACGTATQPATIAGVSRVSIAGQAFACGPELVCNPATQYCSVFAGGPVGVPKSYACAALPDNCLSNPSCNCLPERIGCTCDQSDGRITVTCTAP